MTHVWLSRLLVVSCSSCFPQILNHNYCNSTTLKMSYLEIFILFCIFVLNVMYGLVYDFTKVVPQHCELSVSSLKHLSVFYSWKKTNKETTLTSTMGWKWSSVLTLVYTASLYFSLTQLTHRESDTKYIHTHSVTSSPTSKHIYLICIDNL